MTRLVALAIVSIVMLLPANADTNRRLSDTEWIADIDAFVHDLGAIHPNPFHAISEEAFAAEVDALKAEVPGLSDFAIALRIRRLAALIGDGHTWISYGDTLAPRRIPMRLMEFADGVFIIGGMDSTAKFTGYKLKSIGGVAVEDLLERASQYTSGDNRYGRGFYRLARLQDEAFLREYDLVNPDNTVDLVLSRDGAPETVTLTLVPNSDYSAWEEDDSNFMDADAPLYRSHHNETYWMTYLPEHRALYVQFNAVRNKEGGPHFVGFGQEMIAAVEDYKAKKLIIDLRDNGGGNGALLDPTIRRISENKRINRESRLFVLTSPKTFSAALMFTVRMERNTNALFAGVPGGGKPNSYSEFNAITLPNSGMAGSISSIFHEEGTPDDTRDCVPVDIPVELTSTDYFENRDPVLEAVLAY